MITEWKIVQIYADVKIIIIKIWIFIYPAYSLFNLFVTF